MGKNKQSKDGAPNPSSVGNREIFQRLNFLYQASTYLQVVETSTDKNGDQPKRDSQRRKASLCQLGNSYVQSMRIIGSKSVIRMDPNVKRTLCRTCDSILLPGTTASVRVKGSTKGRRVVYTCLICHNSRAILTPPIMLPPAPVPSPTVLGTIVPNNPLQTTPGPLETADPGTAVDSGTSVHPPKVRKRSAPRPLPLFARLDAGHIIFRGNEALHEEARELES